MRLRYYEAVCNYGLYGIEPDFQGVEQSIWIPMRDLIDSASDRSRVYSDNGKKGGAPVGNTNRNQSKLNEVINESLDHGYYIDNEMALEFVRCGMDPNWLKPPLSFIEFVANRVEESYKNKSSVEKKKIFVTAIKDWDDLKSEYPKWKNDKEKSMALKEDKQHREKTKPKTCTKCGGELGQYNDELYCRKCQLNCSYYEGTQTWEWSNW
ncbi:MAG: hypothetical protein FWH12_02185 [Treponema sp.]|nr:hypothetical protein [Treponema sp.]